MNPGGCGSRGFPTWDIEALRKLIRKYPKSDMKHLARHTIAKLCANGYDFLEQDRKPLLKSAINDLDTIMQEQPNYKEREAVLTLKQNIQNELKKFNWLLSATVDSSTCSSNDPIVVSFQLRNIGEPKSIKLPYDPSQLFFTLKINAIRKNGYKTPATMLNTTKEVRMLRDSTFKSDQFYSQDWDITRPIKTPNYNRPVKIDLSKYDHYEIITMAAPSTYNSDFIYGDTLIVKINR